MFTTTARVCRAKSQDPPFHMQQSICFDVCGPNIYHKQGLKRRQTSALTQQQRNRSKWISPRLEKHIFSCRASTFTCLSSDNNSIPDYVDASVDAYWSAVAIDLPNSRSLSATSHPGFPFTELFSFWIPDFSGATSTCNTALAVYTCA